MVDPDVRRAYYERNREKCQEQSRLYVYQRREQYKEYYRTYWHKNKETLNAKQRQRRAAKRTQPSLRANLDTSNENPVLEQRRQTYLKAKETPLPAQKAKESIQSWNPSPDMFLVTFE